MTFETFGKIPAPDEWSKFKKFFEEEMRLSKSDSKREKPFTAAHQVMGLDETCINADSSKKENIRVKVEGLSSNKSKNAKSLAGKVLQSLGCEEGAGDVIKKLLPSSQRKNADKVAAFALFLHQRQEILVSRTRSTPYASLDTKNDILRTYFFTNIYREADTGTKYYRKQMLIQWPVIGPEELSRLLSTD